MPERRGRRHVPATGRGHVRATSAALHSSDRLGPVGTRHARARPCVDLVPLDRAALPRREPRLVALEVAAAGGAASRRWSWRRARPRAIGRPVAVLGLAVGVSRAATPSSARGRARRGRRGARAARALHGARRGRRRRRSRARGLAALGRPPDGRRVRGRGRRRAGAATLYGGPDDLARGDEVEVVAHARAPQRLWNARRATRARRGARGVTRSGGALDVRVVRAARASLAWIDRARAHVRARIDATFPADTGAHGARARPRRDRTSRADDDRASGRAGSSHLLAVSGMHLVLVLALAVRTLEARRSCAWRRSPRGSTSGASRRPSACPLAWVYAELRGRGRLDGARRVDGDGGAARRAPSAGARTRRARSGCRSWRMALRRPARRVRPVVPALGGGDGGAPRVRAAPRRRASRATRPRAARRRVARSAATTLAATHPVRAHPRALRADAAARGRPREPRGGPGRASSPRCRCASCTRCSAAGPSAERGCALRRVGRARARARHRARGFAIARAHGRRFRRRRAGSSRALASPSLAVVVARAGARGAAPARRSRRSSSLLGGCARRGGAPHGVLRATFLDVGQGDAAIVDLPDGEAMLIDGGGLVGSPIDMGARVVAPVLRARRRDARGAVVLTHPHPDHFGGLATRARRVRVGALWDTGEGERERRRRRLRGAARSDARAAACPSLAPARSAGRATLGGARVEVLAPCPAPFVRSRAERQLVRPADRLWRARVPLRRRRRARGGERRSSRVARGAPAGGRAQGRPPREPHVVVARVPRRRRAPRGGHLRRRAATASATRTRSTLAALAAAGRARLAHRPRRRRRRDHRRRVARRERRLAGDRTSRSVDRRDC